MCGYRKVKRDLHSFLHYMPHGSAGTERVAPLPPPGVIARAPLHRPDRRTGGWVSESAQVVEEERK
jgi:hypothetical protein